MAYAQDPPTVYSEDAESIGRALFELLLTEDVWVHRRVETVGVLAAELYSRATSVDLTIPAPVRDELQVGEKEWLVPVGTFEKRPLRNFSLKDESGRALPVVSKAQNAVLAHHTLLTAANLARNEAGLEGPVSARLANDLWVIASGDVDGAGRAYDCLERASQPDSEAAAILEWPPAAFLVAELAGSYVMLAVVDEIARRRVLKFRYEDSPVSDGTRVGRLLGRARVVLEIPVPAASRGAAYHAELVIPDELRIEAAVLLDGGDSARDVDFNQDRGSLYASGLVLGDPTRVLVLVGMQRAGMLSIAVPVALVVAALLTAGALSTPIDHAQAGSSVSLLLAGSALFAGAVARQGESPVVQAIYSRPRRALLLTALSAVVAAGTVAFDGSPQLQECAWWSTTVISVLALGILIYTYFGAAPTQRGLD